MFNSTLSSNAYVNTGAVLCFLLACLIIYQNFFAFTMNVRQSEHGTNKSLNEEPGMITASLTFFPPLTPYNFAS
jgi:hypothetical protein